MNQGLGKDIKEYRFSERDDFQRKSLAEKIIKLFNSEIDVSPMLIYGGWGTGKSEFCYKTINLIKDDENYKQKYHVVYVDAFKADHIDDPLLSIFSEIVKLLDESTKEQLIDKLKPLVRFGAKTALKAATSWILKQDACDLSEDLEKEIQAGAEKAIDITTERLIKDHIEAEKNLNTLKIHFEKILGQEKEIIIFIDEMDRCRPDFALHLLEVIKHVFDIKGIKIVCITNLEQLHASINHRYGQALEAEKYLDKFFKIKGTLPKSFQRHQHNLNVSCEHFKKMFQDEGLSSDYGSENRNFLEHFIKKSNRSLREVETLIRSIKIYKIINGQELSRFNLLGILIAIFNPNLSNKMISEKFDIFEIANFLGVEKVKPFNQMAGSPNGMERYNIFMAYVAIAYKKHSYGEHSPVQDILNGNSEEQVETIFTRCAGHGEFFSLDACFSEITKGIQSVYLFNV